MHSIDLALRALADGIKVNVGTDFRVIPGCCLSLVYYGGEYRLCVEESGMTLSLNDHNAVWWLLFDPESAAVSDQSTLIADLIEENFG